MSLIPKSEFEERMEKIREVMDRENMDIFLVYGDEYRRKHLRYLSDYWPIFEKAMVAFGKKGTPVLLAGPEGERYANEASVWPDIRVIKEMEISYIPDQIDFCLTRYSSLRDVINDLGNERKLDKVGVCGIDAMSVLTYRAIKKAIGDAQLVDADKIVYKIRLLKSDNEVAALKKATEVCDIGYKAVLDADIVGLTEIEAAAIGEKAARDAGAEYIVFSVFASGEGRTNTVIGRPTDKVIQAGDIIMYALAVQYDGYIATDEWPYVAGNQPTPSQKKLIDSLIIAEDIGIQSIKPRAPAGEVVHRMREYFKENGFQENDLYPPIHGIGLAEAESPYPDENSTYPFEPRMGVNFDVSLFGVKGVGSNRIEEGFIIGENGPINLSPLITELRTTYLKGLKIKG